MADNIIFKIDSSKFDRAFAAYKKTTHTSVSFAVQKQAHNLSLDLYHMFKSIAPTKNKILKLGKKLKWKIHLYKSEKGARGISGGNKKLNARHLDIARELIQRSKAVGASAAGWLAFYNRRLKSGDRLVARNKANTTSANIIISGNDTQVTFTNKVKGIDKTNATHGDLVQQAVNARAEELLQHIIEAHGEAYSLLAQS